MTGTMYLGLLQQCLLPQLQQYSVHFILQQDGTPLHHHRQVSEHVNDRLAKLAIKCGDQELMKWPKRSPDLTHPNSSSGV